MKKFDTYAWLRFIGVCVALPIVAGCAKNSSSDSSSGPTAFSQWSNVQPGSTIQATGFSVQRTYAIDKITGQYSIVGGGSQSTSGATYTGLYDNSGNVALITINNSSGYTFTFDRNQGDTLSNSSGLVGSYVNATNSAATNSGMFANAAANGWNYQSFGVWVTGQGLGAGAVGAVTYGNPTTTLPTTGAYTFTGLSNAVAITSASTAGFATANMSAAVDFGAQTVVISTSNTILTNSTIAKNITSTSAAPQLNYSGLLVFNGTQFSGVVANGAGMSGNAQGQFYGPAAQEIGGTFAMTGSGVQSMTGAFGGKR